MIECAPERLVRRNDSRRTFPHAGCPFFVALCRRVRLAGLRDRPCTGTVSRGNGPIMRTVPRDASPHCCPRADRNCDTHAHCESGNGDCHRIGKTGGQSSAGQTRPAAQTAGFTLFCIDAVAYIPGPFDTWFGNTGGGQEGGSSLNDDGVMGQAAAAGCTPDAAASSARHGCTRDRRSIPYRPPGPEVRRRPDHPPTDAARDR